MNKPINKDWSFVEAINASREAYIGIGLIAAQSRMNYLRAWGCTVGKQEALRGLELALTENSELEIAQAIGVKIPSVKKLKKYFKEIPQAQVLTQSQYSGYFVRGEEIALEEDRRYEFKEIKGVNPEGAIKNTVDNYVVAALNSEGGSIFWGVKDDRTVLGFSVSAKERDSIRKSVWDKLLNIQPKIDPTAFTVHFHCVVDKTDKEIPNLYVLEVITPKINTQTLYFTSGNEAFVRIDGVKKKLSGPEIQDWILRRVKE